MYIRYRDNIIGDDFDASILYNQACLKYYGIKSDMACNLYIELTINNMHVDAGSLRHSGHATVVSRVAWLCMGDPQSVTERKTDIRSKHNRPLFRKIFNYP